MPESRHLDLPILLVDDEEPFLNSVHFSLLQEGIDNVELCHDSRQVMDLLSKQNFSVVALDLNMPFLSGRELLDKVTSEYPDITVIMITASNDVETAVQCIKAGAFDYAVKPVSKQRLVTCIRKALQHREIIREAANLRLHVLYDRIEHPEAFSPIITNNRNMLNVFKYVEAIGQTELPVLITGETGVGKDLIAEALHKVSNRIGDFVPVNAAGLDDALFSDSLFGHVRGAFTGAHEKRIGLIEQAQNGTLFLDEIGDLVPESQVRLLRLLQDGTYLPVGSDIQKRSSARIITASNKNITAMQKEGRFRNDLFYRLQSHQVHVPPLRERMSDLELLVDHFLSEAARELKKKKPTPPRELYTLLKTYHFPGNIRELRGMIFDAVSTHSSGVLSLETLKNKILGNRDNPDIHQAGTKCSNDSRFPCDSGERFSTLKQIEQMHVREALQRTDGNITLAAQLLGIKRQSLQARLRKTPL